MNLLFLVCIICINSVLLSLSVLEELCCNLFKECIGKYVLILLDVLSALLTKCIKLGSKEICRTACDRLVLADDLTSEFIGDGSGTLTVLASYKSLKLLGNSCVSSFVSKENVINRLSTNDL